MRHEEALAVWWILGLGFAFGLLPRVRPPRGVLIPLGAIFLLAVWTALSLTWTESSERTFAELARVLHYGGLLVLIFALVDRATWEAAAAGVLAGAVVVCGLALASRLAPGSFPHNYILSVFDTNRLSYPLNYWNGVAAWGAMTTTMALAWSAHARTLVVRAATLAAVPLAVLVTYLTYSRQGIIGTAVGVAAVLALSRNRWTVALHCLGAAVGGWIAIAEVRSHPGIVHATSGSGAGGVLLILALAVALSLATAALAPLGRTDSLRLPRRVGRAVVVGGVLVAVLAVATAGHSAVRKGWDEFHSSSAPVVNPKDPSARLTNLNSGRYKQWRAAWKAFESEPFHGIGSGAYEFWWDRTGDVGTVQNAHSLYFETLAELGIPGLLLVLAALIGLLVRAVVVRPTLTSVPSIGAHTAMLAGFIVFLLHAGIDWMWQVTAMTAMGLAAGGFAAAAGSIPTLDRPRAIRLAVTVLAIVVVAIELPSLVSTSRLRASQASFRRGDITAATAQANDAIHAEPWAATPYEQRGLIEEYTNSLAAARTDLERAVTREPTNWRPRLLLARIDAEAGDPQAALAAFREARKLRPNGNFFRVPFG